MRLFTVYVEDHITHERVCVLDMASRAEAMDLVNYIAQFMACTVYMCETNFKYKKEKGE